MRSKTNTLGVKKILLIIFLFSINIFTVYWANTFDFNTPVKDAWSNYQSDLPDISKTTTDSTTGLNNWVWPTVKNAENLTPWPTTVVVTENIPWAECVPYKGKDWEALTDITNRKFKCIVEPGFWSVMQMFAGLVKYATFLAALVGVLMIAVAWVRLSISGIESGEKAKAKEMITKVIFSLILLFLIWFILNSVAPWIYG
ncbi:MAG: hypothetical protein ACD_49C00060G0008 [uncultured bacterium (gcode 4)]|uniref:Uncharacterized protein n=1 Tax=uncultured bacterium (gcode 4) TaxID=1234023 RepID=K2AWX1_9BACT|nr:MAG: hypothetical protein ACD_49C00060G0008 [uncultured bacterium (gcode 4)]